MHKAPAPLLSLAALLIVCSFASAAKTPLQDFLSDSFEPDQVVKTAELAGSPGVYMVTAGGKETYIWSSGTNRTVEGHDEITALLLLDLYNRTLLDAKLVRVYGVAGNASAAKDADEKKCMQYTGVDMHSCTDKQTCTVSCFAVPQCEIMIQSYKFLDAIMAWNDDRQEFDSLLATLDEGMEMINSSGSLPFLAEKDAILAQLQSLSEKLSTSPLLLPGNASGCDNGENRCFEYCPQANYSQQAFADARALLAEISSIQRVASQQASRAEGIANRTAQNNAYLSTRGRDFEELRVRMTQNLTALQSRIDAISTNITDPSLAQMHSSLSAISASIQSDADAGYYRRALSKKPQYEAAYTELSDRISYDSARYSELQSALSSFSSRVAKSQQIIGNQSATSYRLRIAEMNATVASGNATLELLASQYNILSSINQSLTEEIASKATGETPQAGGKTIQIQVPQGPLPCLPALALLLIAALALSRRGG